MVAYRRIKTKENFTFSALKKIAVPYERWLLTTGSTYSDLTWKLLVFWSLSRDGCNWWFHFFHQLRYDIVHWNACISGRCTFCKLAHSQEKEQCSSHLCFKSFLGPLCPCQKNPQKCTRIHCFSNSFLPGHQLGHQSDNQNSWKGITDICIPFF